MYEVVLFNSLYGELKRLELSKKSEAISSYYLCIADFIEYCTYSKRKEGKEFTMQMK